MKNATMKTQSLVNGKWVFSTCETETLCVGDVVSFTCNGQGRGGHYGVTGTATNVKRATFDVVEDACSYREGTKWNLRKDMQSLFIIIR